MQVERLGEGHDISNFACGVKPLDDWLRSHALENQRRNLSRTFVLLDDAGAVIGYYALTMGGVTKDELPRRLGRGLPGYQSGMVLLARLAVDATRHGEGLGRDLLVDAVVQAAAAGQHAAALFIAVDPIDDSARRFYRRFGFIDIDGDEHGRMFIRLDHALASLDTAQGQD
ncbi:MAG: GNAT family N-acetyltransferase [Mycobacteriales bacterium]